MGADDAGWSPGKSTPYRHADGRPKASPEETSLFGLNAVWSELGSKPAPEQAEPTRRRSRHSSQARRRKVWPVVALICAAMLCAVAMIWVLLNL
jgi:ferric-dicitrate binding protein FerR (iron transport regulator)